MKRIGLVSIIASLCLLKPLLATEIAPERVVGGDRWFEVEFILFQRTPDAGLIESFDSSPKAAKPARFFDVLKPFYQPDIRPLLGQLELCQSSKPQPIAHQAEPDLADYLPRFQWPHHNALCVFEPQPKLWQQPLFASPVVIDTLPMPRALALTPSGQRQHRNAPYLLAADELQFGDIIQRLRRQGDVQLLLHAGYRQAPVTERRSIPSRWYAGRDLRTQSFERNQSAASSDVRPGQISLLQPNLLKRIEQRYQALVTDTADSDEQSMLIDLTMLNEQQSSEPWWQLDGFIRLHLDHYLFVNTDFVLSTLVTEQQLLPHRIQFSRRVISGEMHYIDHPKLGMILQIRRYQPPTSAEQ
ncbi:CsiV family protein [Alkalimonas amylolytica]|uniref:Peptidoglycan-binding protein, CsiV n=1 Tax=Alkalimonas amylolytica TaxID=152573 RepID=A0A1H3ZXQ1_ALKAM|nr:CsiV family protein [Alkalimonas amylolytica]SEA28469.1 Peptidoglycan-binding protein, CsiV [Alkalimonas amylolytica]